MATIWLTARHGGAGRTASASAHGWDCRAAQPARGVRIVRARAIVIEGAEGEPVHADGDVVGILPARFVIAPGTLMVAAPPRQPVNLC